MQRLRLCPLRAGKTSLVWALTAMIALTLSGATAADSDKDGKSKLPAGVAEIVLKGSLDEGPSMPGLFGETTVSLSDVIGRLKQAAEDKRVDAVILKISGDSFGWGKLNELRQAIDRVRAADKPVYAYLEGGNSLQYLLAASCDQVVMPEPATLMLLGLRAEVTFYKKLFDMLSVEPEMLRVGKYKSAAEPYMRTEMSDEFREEMEAILEDYYGQMVGIIAEERKLERDIVESVIDSGPHMAADAKKLRLIDIVGYESQIETLIAERFDKRVRVLQNYGKKQLDTDFSGMTGMLKLMNMMLGIEEPERRTLAAKVAVIYAVGPITSGKSSVDLFSGASMGSETIIKAIRTAQKTDEVKAIVLRVDSPGGSALASDLIWHELEQTEKPFVVSMGNTAGSGGYYIAMGADRIFAEPGTITGSIGVLGGKLAITGLMERVGVTTSVIQRGKNAGLIGSLAPFTPGERDAMQRLLANIYEQFTTKAAAGRGMPLDKLTALAGGRIYTGRMALENGLIDELGTLEDAIAHAMELAELDPKEDRVERMILPRAVSPFEQLFGGLEAGASIESSVPAVLGRWWPELAGQLAPLRTFEQLAREPAVIVMPFGLSIH